MQRHRQYGGVSRLYGPCFKSIYIFKFHFIILRHRPPSPEPEEKRPAKRERAAEEAKSTSDSPAKPAAKKDEQPPPKKMKEEKEEEPPPEVTESSLAEATSAEQVEVNKEAVEKDVKPESTDDQKMDTEEVYNPHPQPLITGDNKGCLKSLS